jgi:acyl-CoA synthetase (AMP-forming)/AMP-acid ligase II
MVGFRPDDRFYVAQPLYHTAGGAMSVGQALIFGSCVVIRKKFSASAYISDIKKYECTVPTCEIFATLSILVDSQWFLGCFINGLYIILFYFTVPSLTSSVLSSYQVEVRKHVQQ